MPNTAPIWTKVGRVKGVAVTAANTKSDGSGTIGTDIFLAGTVHNTEGGFLKAIEWYPTANVANTPTTATIGRAFLSSLSSGATTASNTDPLAPDVSLNSVTAANSASPVSPVVQIVNKAVDPGKSVLVTNHAAPAANTAWKAVLIWGDYA